MSDRLRGPHEPRRVRRVTGTWPGVVPDDERIAALRARALADREWARDTHDLLLSERAAGRVPLLTELGDVVPENRYTLAYFRSDDDQVISLIGNCPNCGRLFLHGGGTDLSNIADGWRASHCRPDLCGLRGYYLEVVGAWTPEVQRSLRRRRRELRSVR